MNQKRHSRVSNFSHHSRHQQLYIPPQLYHQRSYEDFQKRISNPTLPLDPHPDNVYLPPELTKELSKQQTSKWWVMGVICVLLLIVIVSTLVVFQRTRKQKSGENVEGKIGKVGLREKVADEGCKNGYYGVGGKCVRCGEGDMWRKECRRELEVNQREEKEIDRMSKEKKQDQLGDQSHSHFEVLPEQYAQHLNSRDWYFNQKSHQSRQLRLKIRQSADQTSNLLYY